MASFLDDDGSLSGEFIAIEDPDSEGHRQALWVRVGPVFHGNKPDREPGIWITYQEEYMGCGMRDPLNGPVLLSPRTWRELNRAVRWRLRKRAVRRLLRKTR